MISTWHIVISGFTQKEDSYNGCERLWEALTAHLSPTCVVMQKEWDDDFDRLAARIKRCSGDRPTVYIYAYSWGAGNGFVSLAKALREYGIFVEVAVLCDPVYYSRLPLWSIRFLGALAGKDIEVPANVKRAAYFIQRVNYPRGSKVVAEDPVYTTITEPVLLALPHGDMEDSQHWHAACLRAAEQE